MINDLYIRGDNEGNFNQYNYGQSFHICALYVVCQLFYVYLFTTFY